MILVATNLSSQVYKKEIIYKYKYEITNSKGKLSGMIYLGCLGEQLPVEFDSAQTAIIWSEDIEKIKKKHISTGIIENNHRIWMHPPRFGKFSILEYSPFPEIRFPLNINHKWTNSLQPGRHWVNEEYNIKATDVLSYSFVIEKKVKKSYPFSPDLLPCYKVVANSQKALNKTKFIGYFNPDYGFVEMVFENIDGSTIRLSLNEILIWAEKNNIFNNSWGF